MPLNIPDLPPLEPGLDLILFTTLAPAALFGLSMALLVYTFWDCF